MANRVSTRTPVLLPAPSLSSVELIPGRDHYSTFPRVSRLLCKLNSSEPTSPPTHRRFACAAFSPAAPRVRVVSGRRAHPCMPQHANVDMAPAVKAMSSRPHVLVLCCQEVTWCVVWMCPPWKRNQGAKLTTEAG